MKVPAQYNKNSRMDLVKGGFEGAAVWISFFNRRIAGAVVKILFAFHLEEKEEITRSSWLNCALRNDEAVQRGPKSVNFPDGKIQRAKTFRTKCVNRFCDK